MKYRATLLLVLSALLMACSATGPVRFYSGPPKQKDQLAIVEVPAAISVLSIDGKAVDSPSKESGSYEVQLEPGFHLIEFRYVLFWGTYESGKLVKSKNTGVDAVFEAGKTYAIRYKKPQDADEAEDFFNDFKANLVDLSSGKQYSSYEIKDLEATLAAHQAKMQAASQAPAVTTGTGSSLPNAETATNADPLKRLKFWWLMANQQERKEFTQWMKTANESFAPASKKAPDAAPPGTINGVKIKP